MSAPLGVSIIIANRNYARFLGEAIDSALAQTHPLVEVVVVDDGSTDESRAVIERYAGRLTAVFQANAGQTMACAAGIRVSRHPVIIFLDADDRLEPGAASLAAADWPDGVSKKQFSLQTLDARGRLLDHHWPKYSVHPDPATARAELLRTGYYPCPPTSGNAFARWFIERVWPFDENPYVDSLLNTLAPLYGDVLTIDRPFGHYRIHGSNMYCTSAVEAARFDRYIAADELRVAILARHCKALGIPFAGQAVLRNLLPFREIEVVIAKLNAVSLADQWGVLRHLAGALKAGLHHPQTMWHRLIRWFWITAIALAPQRLARPLIALRYLPIERPRLIELLANGGLFRSRSAAH